MRTTKNTNFSSTSKYSTAFTEEECEQHQGQTFTNFCSAITCVRPLCPQCVQNHSLHHKNMKTPAQIHSFKTLKNKCVNKIATILQKLEQSSNQSTLSQLNDIFQSSLTKIRQLKTHLKNILDSYFLNLQDTIKKKMNVLMSQQSHLFQQLDKANNIVNQLKLLVHMLDNQRDFISSAQTIVHLDTDKIQQKVKKSYNTAYNLKQHYRFNCHIEKSYDQNFLTCLTHLAYYGQPGTNDSMPTLTQQILSKNSMKIISRSRLARHQKKNSNNQSDSQIRSKQKQYIGRGDRSWSKQKQRDQQDQLKRSNTSRKSSKTSTRPKKNIIGMNTFKQSSQLKYLHFFQNDKNILHYLDLSSTDITFTSININISFKIPQFHKSIAIPNGDLYLIGGNISDQLKSQKIYRYDFQKNTLIYCNNLKYGRSSHSICFNNKYIYILGGILNNQVITNRCQRYDIITNKVEQIKSMNYQASTFACCSFNGRFIYKIGGIEDNNCISNTIQVFDEKQGTWRIINPLISQNQDRLIPLASSASTQISQNQIMVMGGYKQDNIGQKQTYIIHIDPTQTSIRDINTYPLPFPEGFWNNIPIIQNKMIFLLQNVSEGQDQCIENFRKILVFDGQGWKCLNN